MFREVLMDSVCFPKHPISALLSQVLCVAVCDWMPIAPWSSHYYPSHNSVPLCP